MFRASRKTGPLARRSRDWRHFLLPVVTGSGAAGWEGGRRVGEGERGAGGECRGGAGAVSVAGRPLRPGGGVRRCAGSSEGGGRPWSTQSGHDAAKPWRWDAPELMDAALSAECGPGPRGGAGYPQGAQPGRGTTRFFQAPESLWGTPPGGVPGARRGLVLRG